MKNVPWNRRGIIVLLFANTFGNTNVKTKENFESWGKSEMPWERGLRKKCFSAELLIHPRSSNIPLNIQLCPRWRGKEVAEGRASEGERPEFPKFGILFLRFINALQRGNCIVGNWRNSAMYLCLANLWQKRSPNSKAEGGRGKYGEGGERETRTLHHRNNQWRNPQPTYAVWERGEQEQTKFYDLRRGITEDFQRLAKFQRTLSKSTKKIHQF